MNIQIDIYIYTVYRLGALLEVELRKICTTLRRESNFREKKATRCMFGALLEVEPRKICTTLWRESDLEVKIVKI